MISREGSKKLRRTMLIASTRTGAKKRSERKGGQVSYPAKKAAFLQDADWPQSVPQQLIAHAGQQEKESRIGRDSPARMMQAKNPS